MKKRGTRFNPRIKSFRPGATRRIIRGGRKVTHNLEYAFGGKEAAHNAQRRYGGRVLRLPKKLAKESKGKYGLYIAE